MVRWKRPDGGKKNKLPDKMGGGGGDVMVVVKG